MRKRFERILTFGAPAVNYRIPETWTRDVKDLYDRLKEGDTTALAPLLEWDIEFICDPMAVSALVILKFDPQQPAGLARQELRRIANVITRRPAHRKTKLPYGDQLLDELEKLTAWISSHGLLEIKNDEEVLRKRILELLEPPRPAIPPKEEWPQIEGKPVYVPPREMDAVPMPPAIRAKLCDAITVGVRLPGALPVRKPRAWAVQALAQYYDVAPKAIEKCISRDLKSGRRKR